MTNNLPQNQFKRALVAGRQQIGLWVSLASPYSAELVAGTGFDWLVIDTEHSPNEVDTTLAQLQVIAAYPASPVVRPAWNDKVLIKRHLDIGAQTLLIPYVQDAAEAEAAVAAVRFPLRGVRGVAGVTRASQFGRVKDYAKRAEEEICLLVQIETRAGLDNLEKIARTDGVDGVFIGPADLAAGLGHLGRPTAPGSAIGDPGGHPADPRLRKARGHPRDRRGLDAALHGMGNDVHRGRLDAMVLARELEKLSAKFREKTHLPLRSSPSSQGLCAGRPRRLARPAGALGRAFRARWRERSHRARGGRRRLPSA
jgi:4-hydroxy-2-oxoheptanedioate aldolase